MPKNTDAITEKRSFTRRPREGADAPGRRDAKPQLARRDARRSGPAKPGDRKNAGGEAHPHTEENLDHGLDETFPAGDPVSISPGAD